MIMTEQTIVELCEKAKENESLMEEIESLARLNNITTEYICKIIRREGIELPPEYKLKKAVEAADVDKLKKAMESANAFVVSTDQMTLPMPDVVRGIFEKALEDLEKEIEYHESKLKQLNAKYKVITDYIK